MRLVQYRAKGGSRLGVVIQDRVVDVQRAAASAGLKEREYASTVTLLEASEELGIGMMGLDIAKLEKGELMQTRGW